jgi:hypothetical protein
MAADVKLDRDDVRSIAIYQKGILVCILVYIIIIVSQFLIPQQFRFVLALVVLVVSIIDTVFIFLLTTKIYGVGLAVVLGLLSLIPFVGLIVLLIVNGKATSILRSHGVRVGLMGARLADIK